MKPENAPRHIAILGATSGMAEQTARLLAAQGNSLILVARNQARLDALVTDLAIRGDGHINSHQQDLEHVDDASAFFEMLANEFGTIDGVFIFHGYLGDQSLALTNQQELNRIISVNLTSTMRLAVAAKAALNASAHEKPVLMAVGSVAGDRGRASNYVYGSTKAAVCTLFEGMIHDAALKKQKTVFVLVKAGLTDSPMTAHLPKDGLLWSSTETVAKVIVNAMDNGSTVVYAPAYWRIIMTIIRLLPQFVLNKINL